MLPLRILLFNLLLLAACWYAIRRGGRPEQCAAGMLAIAAVCTAALPRSLFEHVETGQVAVDAVLLVGLMVLAVRADRFWPMAIAALQLVAISVHGVRAYDATILPALYNQAIGKLAYPMLLLLALGTHRHRRRALAGRPERDWSPLIWR